MYAVFDVSGVQFTAQEGDVLKVPFQKAEPGTKLDIDKVLLIKNDDTALVGTPTVDNAKIEAEVLGSGTHDRIIVYKYKRRTKYRRNAGHRQQYTEIKINKIVTPE